MKNNGFLINRLISLGLTSVLILPLGIYVHAQESAPGWKGIGDNSYYLMEGTAERATGLTEIDDHLYYFSGTGEMQSGWQTISSYNYYFDENGKALTGMQEINGKKYNFQSDGKLRNGWSDDGLQYYDGNGFVTKSDFVHTDNQDYYFDSNGIKVTGWQEIEGKTYYFNEKGEMARDKATIDGQKYYFEEDGQYLTGWQDLDGKQVYHSTKNGLILKNKAEKIDGVLRYFGEDGTMLKNKKVDGYEIDKNGVAKRVATKAEKEEAERKAEEKKRKEEEEAQRIAEEEQKKYEQQQAEYRKKTQAVKDGIKTDGSTASIIANAALAQLGRTQDCTMLATNALAAAGINFHDWPENYSALGSWTSNPVPGDLCIYSGHIAVYVGNGQAVHGGWNGWTTIKYSVACNNPFLGYIHVGG